jgi:hypothetical protein
MFRLKGFFTTFVVLAVLPQLGAFASAQDKRAEITSLQKERSDVLNKAVALLTVQYRAGASRMDTVCQVCKEAIVADLELANGVQQRMIVLRKHKALADEFLRQADAREKAALIMKTDVYQAEALQLRIRIDLLKEEQKLEQQKK